jgi:hypothetical protein
MKPKVEKKPTKKLENPLESKNQLKLKNFSKVNTRNVSVSN